METKEISKEEALRNWREEPFYLKEKATGDIYRANIREDNMAPNPRTDYDNICTITSCVGNWDIGDDGQHLQRDEIEEWTDNLLYRENNGTVYSLPVYMYEHSGMAISLKPFGDPFDSGICGRIWVEKKKIFEEFPEEATEENWKKIAFRCMKNEIEVYNQYFCGDVYGYTLERDSFIVTTPRRSTGEIVNTSPAWEMVGSYWGFYGDIRESGLVDLIFDDDRFIPVKLIEENK